ncbi:MAG: hypothetical protein C0491_02545 [Novosphingobium sp.]|nr:hypothetical protein [Novosphingobium sp.]
MSKEQLKQVLDAATKAADAILAERDNLIREARDRITAEYADRLGAARAARQEASDAYREAISNEANHPWDGKRVYKLVHIKDRWSSKILETKRVEGLVEVVRLSSQFPANLTTWTRPKLGSVVVRKIKKDGTPSLQLEQGYHLNGLSPAWKLVDDDSHA